MAKFTFHFETDEFREFRDEIQLVAQALGLFAPRVALEPAEVEIIKAQGPGPAVTARWEDTLQTRPAGEAAAARLNAIAAAEATLTAVDEPEPVKVRRTRKIKEAATASPEEAKPAANGATQTETPAIDVSAPPAELKRSDLSDLFHNYQDAYGYDALAKDGRRVLIEATGVASVGKIPEDQAVLRKAFDAIAGMLRDNPFGREKVSG